MVMAIPPRALVHARICSVVALDSEYPTELQQAIVLTDGTELRLRPIRPDDAARLHDHEPAASRLGARARECGLPAPPRPRGGAGPCGDARAGGGSPLRAH